MNTILYIGLSFIFIGGLFFFYCVHSIAKYERELYKQKQLDKSFKNADKTNERTYNDCQ